MPRSRRSALLLLTIVCAVGAMLPALPAHAGGPVCVYDAGSHTVNLNIGGTAPVTLARDGMTIESNGSPCFTGLNTATVTNTETVNIVGDGLVNDLTIDLHEGRFAPGFTNENGISDEIEFSVELAGGSDVITIAGTPNADNIRVGEFSSAYGVNLNAGESKKVDADLLSGDGTLSFVLFGAGGNDVLSAAGGRGIDDPLNPSIQMSGDGGDDRLTGGNGVDDLGDKSGHDADIIKGGASSDIMFAVDGDGDDVLNGQTGPDVCDGDPHDTTMSCAQPA